MSSIFYSEGDKSLGPVSEDYLRQLLAGRHINRETLVWHEGMAEWQSLGLRYPSWLQASGEVAEMERCAVSGQVLPKVEMVQFGDVFVAPDQRDVYVQRLQQGVQSPASLTAAGIGERFGANFIDGLIFVVPAVCIGVLTSPDLTAATGTTEATDQGSIVLLALILGVVLGSVLYETIMVGAKRATLGKLALKIEVVRADGGRVGYGRALSRCCVKGFVPQLPYVGIFIHLGSIIMALVDSNQRRALHDRVVSTRVVKRQQQKR